MTSRGRNVGKTALCLCVRGSGLADVKSAFKHLDDGEGKHVRGAQTGLAWYGVGCGRAGRPLGGRRWQDSPRLTLLSLGRIDAWLVLGSRLFTNLLTRA